MNELTTDQEIRQVLTDARTVAVLGAHVKEHKPAYYVPEYLHTQGYRILPVNPVFTGQTSWNEPFKSALAELRESVDIVDVFRLSELLPMHVEDILAMSPRPKLVWLQLGIRNDAVAGELMAAGIDVVQDRCTLADHQRFGLGPVGAPSS